MNRQELLDWVAEEYGITEEYPWQDENAILRHTSNRKWFAALLRVGRSRLGLSGSGCVDVVNLKCDPLLAASLRGKPGFFPAYHMNKDQWISILLDGSLTGAEILPLLEMSYRLTDIRKKNQNPVQKKESHQ